MGRLYKYLNADGTTPLGYGKWDLPNGKPGKWQKVKGELIPCVNGLHLMREKDLLDWGGPLLVEMEARGDRVDSDNKIVVREARCLKLTAMDDCRWRLFACDCASRALRGIKKPDKRSLDAIRVARRFARGKATDKERAAASAAAWAADGAAWAADGAAWDAAWAAAGAARDAARAAWDADGAARDAARAARDAERNWQIKRLLRYASGELPDQIPLPESSPRPEGKAPQGAPQKAADKTDKNG